MSEARNDIELAVTFAIGETLLGLAGLALALPLAAALAVSFAKPSNRATPEEEAAHRAEFGVQGGTAAR